MKLHTAEDIKTKVEEIWKAQGCDPGKVTVDASAKLVRIKFEAMYEPPGLTFAHLLALSAFFETQRINDDDRFSYAGCETCDYGSSYGFTLSIRHE